MFRQIQLDVDKKIEQVKKVLLEKLVQFPCSPDDQKIIIEYLYSIGFNQFDAGWYCLEQEKQWIINHIIKCRDMHIADETVSLLMKDGDNGGTNNNSATATNNSVSNAATALVSSNLNTSTNTTKNAPIQPHERNKFIEELCEMVLDLFTDYWRIGNMYSQGYLLPKRVDDEIKSKTSKQIKLHTLEEYHTLVKEILTTFSNIVRVAFIPQTLEKVLNQSDEKYKQLFTQWPQQQDSKLKSQILPHCLRICR